MFLTIVVVALIVSVQAENQEHTKYAGKRGAASSTPSALSSAQQQAYAIKLRQYQQAQAQAEEQSSAEVRYVPQSKYTASPVAYTSGAAPVQYHPQQQAVAYLKQAAAPVYSKAAYQVAQPVSSPVQHYSLATDVSSFSYSSPIVRYSNLGLLSQISGKDSETAYQAAQAPAPKATYYQAAPPAQAQHPQTRIQYVPQYESYQQAEQKSTQASQNYVIAPSKYVSSAPQQRYIYVSAQDVAQGQASAAPQQYVYQAIAQPQYEQQYQTQAQQQYQAQAQQQYQAQAQQQYQTQPQYEKQAQASPSVAQVVYAQIPQQYQQQQQYQQSSATKQVAAYEN